MKNDVSGPQCSLQRELLSVYAEGFTTVAATVFAVMKLSGSTDDGIATMLLNLRGGSTLQCGAGEVCCECHHLSGNNWTTTPNGTARFK